jgi:hypothetical protein
MADVQWPHLVALMGTFIRHSGQSFSVGSGFFLKRSSYFTRTKTMKARMKSSTTLSMKMP